MLAVLVFVSRCRRFVNELRQGINGTSLPQLSLSRGYTLKSSPKRSCSMVGVAFTITRNAPDELKETC